MTISLPIPLAFQSSNVKDDVPTIEDLTAGCQKPIIRKGLEVADTHWVWEYKGDEEFLVKDYNPSYPDYEIGDIVWKDCKLQKITGKKVTGKKVPLEPEEYSCFDTSFDPDTWKCRWVRVEARPHGWVQLRQQVGYRLYFFYFENRGSGGLRGCGHGQWVQMVTDITDPNYPVFTGATYPNLRSCFEGGYSNKYNPAADKKAKVFMWDGGVAGHDQKTVLFYSMIERGGYWYLRTNLDIPVEYKGLTTTYTFMEVLSPADIDGFEKKRLTHALLPFDDKNYTATKYTTEAPDHNATWVCINTEPFNTIAFGRVLCDNITIRITFPDGKLVEINNYEVDNTVAFNSSIEYPETIVLYVGETVPFNSVIEVILHGYYIQLGMLKGGEMLDAGMTNVAFNNRFRDFSPKEQDQWGNVYYKDGVRVKVHTGTVDMPVVRYDQMDRLMLMVGGREVIIDSSDAVNNNPANSRDIFTSTMMIGRFTQFDLKTKEENKKIGEYATYSFAIEEVV